MYEYIKVIEQIAKKFHYRDKHTFFTLYKQYVRPQLECATSAWTPWFAGDIKMIEKVQEKALKNHNRSQGNNLWTKMQGGRAGNSKGEGEKPGHVAGDYNMEGNWQDTAGQHLCEKTGHNIQDHHLTHATWQRNQREQILDCTTMGSEW
jgi:hypothetical protein